MKRDLKALGLALAAAFAMSAMVASAAQATPATFTAAAYPTVITGHQEGGKDFNTNYTELTPGRKVSCSEATYEATLTGPGGSKELTVTPHYTGCETNDGLAAEIRLNGCHYLFTIGTNTNPEDTHGSLHVVCPPGGASIQYVVGGGICVVDVPAQSPTGGVTFLNKGGSTVTIRLDVTGKLKYTDTDASFFCPFSGSATFENGSLVTDVTAHCYVDKGSANGTTTQDNGTVINKTVYTHANEARNCDVR